MEDPARSYPEHPVTAVGAVVFDNRRVLLVKRARPPAEGLWSIPGGVVKAGETLADAVAREVMEECSIEVEAGPLVEAVERIDRDEADGLLYHYVILDFLAEYIGGEPRAGSDAAEARWVDAADLDALDCTGGLTALVAKAQAMKEGESGRK